MGDSGYTVYMHVNKINGKRYIGITRLNVSQRWANGKGYKTQDHFYRAIQKYGWDGFEHIVIFSGIDEKSAEKREQELIKKYNTLSPDFGYNKTSGGESKKVMSDETIQKMRLANIGKNNPQFGKRATEEARQKMSVARRGAKNPRYGKKLSNETKIKISLSLKGLKQSEETRKKKSESGLSRKTIKKVVNITTGDVFLSAKEAAEKMGVSYTCVRDACNGNQKTACGCKWAYCDDYTKGGQHK